MYRSSTVHDLDPAGKISYIYIYIPDLYDLARVTGREPHILHDLGHVSWVGYVRYSSCANSRSGSM